MHHVGQLPYLMSAGYAGPIYCSRPTALLVPLMLEDALKVGYTRNPQTIQAFLEKMGDFLHPLDYDTWQDLDHGARL